ncbi:MAG: histidine--tRNA ligase [Alphaproteobacteria bacterium]|nr:histidine--tRNA ligase [Alphaproteobacteria bacterium]
MAKLQPVRGTRDLIGEDSRTHLHIGDLARATAGGYGYTPIETPVFEFTEVFKRTLGDTSDIVTKEMYTFEDKGGDSLTLRPEGTAGIARAVLSGGLQNEMPLKWCYAGPMFRHERPQKGRLRQFHQIGVELIGVADPVGDIEVIALAAATLDALGVLPATILELNTLGDGESRATYRTALVGYLEGFRDRLSEDSQQRLDRNPLRILDSKDKGDQAIVADAPSFSDYLTPEAQAFFDSVRGGLDDLGIAYQLNPRLVRGLDYYCHTAFEFTTDQLGAQGTVLAGGRYDGLIEMMGGQPTPGVGWAAGIERLAMLTGPAPAGARAISVIGIGDAGEKAAAQVAQDLRQAGFTVELNYRGGLKRGLKRADKIGAAAAVFLGDDELARDGVTVRNLDDGSQSDVTLAGLKDHLAAYR